VLREWEREWERDLVLEVEFVRGTWEGAREFECEPFRALAFELVPSLELGPALDWELDWELHWELDWLECDLVRESKSAAV